MSKAIIETGKARASETVVTAKDRPRPGLVGAILSVMLGGMLSERLLNESTADRLMAKTKDAQNIEDQYAAFSKTSPTASELKNPAYIQHEIISKLVLQNESTQVSQEMTEDSTNIQNTEQEIQAMGNIGRSAKGILDRLRTR